MDVTFEQLYKTTLNSAQKPVSREDLITYLLMNIYAHGSPQKNPNRILFSNWKTSMMRWRYKNPHEYDALQRATNIQYFSH